MPELDEAAILLVNGRFTIAKQACKPSSVLDREQFTAEAFILLLVKW